MTKPRSSAVLPKGPTAFRLQPVLPSEFSPVSSDEAEALSAAREWTLSERSFSDVSFARIELSKVTAESCVFDQVSFNQGEVGSMRCKDVVFQIATWRTYMYASCSRPELNLRIAG